MPIKTKLSTVKSLNAIFGSSKPNKVRLPTNPQVWIIADKHGRKVATRPIVKSDHQALKKCGDCNEPAVHLNVELEGKGASREAWGWCGQCHIGG